MYAVILAGGKGKRFWPASRESKPKQFLDISGRGSMLSVTYRRLSRLVPSEKILLLTIESQLDIARDELPDLPRENIVTEPAGRNTAPALALAALLVKHRSGDEPLLACPADHLISKTDNFNRAVNLAEEIAVEKDLLFTFGIQPDYPATGYGYIEAGEMMEDGRRKSFFRVKSFHEKPSRDRAEDYLGRGGFYWNSGIFLWRPSVYLNAWSRFISKGEGPLYAIAESIGEAGLKQILEEEYPRLPAISVDYGILEKADNVAVIPVDFGWSDVGSWDALYDILAKDRSGNVIIGNSVELESENCIFYNEEGVIASIGLKDVIIIAAGNTVLACRKGESQRVRDIVELMSKEGFEELL